MTGAGNARGFSLAELAVAATLAAIALSALLAFAMAAQASLEAEPAAADAQQRLRAAAVVLREAVQDAGSGFLLDPDRAPGHAVPALAPVPAVAGAWPAAAAGAVVTTLASPPGGARGRLTSDVAAGGLTLSLAPPSYCGGATCGFAAGDAVAIYDEAGALVLAAVRRVDPPLALVLAAPLPTAFAAGAWVAQADVTTIAAQATPEGLQLTRARGLGVAGPVVDQLRRFEVEWWGTAAPPQVLPAIDGSAGRTTAGPLPPTGRALPGGAWPAGENCVFAVDAAGAWTSRLPARGAGLVAIPLAELQDGPWCPGPAAPGRWDADLLRLRQVRVTIAADAAAEHLRAPVPMLPGGRARRTVPPVETRLVLEPGRWLGAPR